MKKYSIAILVVFIASAGISSARIGGCGDGNQRYTQSKHGDTVRYFADVNEFNIIQSSDTSVVVEDTVECRYGRDTIINVSNIEFLGTSFTIPELVGHQTKKNLSTSVVQTFLFDNLAVQISNLGIDPFSETSSQERDVNTRLSSTNQSNNVSQSNATSNVSRSNRFTYTSNRSTNSNLTVSNNLGSLTSSFSPGSYSANSNSGAGLSAYNNSTGSNSRSNPYSSYTSGDFNYSSSYSASSAFSGATNRGFRSNSLAPGISAAPLGQITARWNTQAINPSAIVYIEAIDSSDRRHYLGSSIAGQGQRTLDIPSYLDGESSLTIYVRSGSTVVDTFDVQL